MYLDHHIHLDNEQEFLNKNLIKLIVLLTIFES